MIGRLLGDSRKTSLYSFLRSVLGFGVPIAVFMLIGGANKFPLAGRLFDVLAAMNLFAILCLHFSLARAIDLWWLWLSEAVGFVLFCLFVSYAVDHSFSIATVLIAVFSFPLYSVFLGVDVYKDPLKSSPDDNPSDVEDGKDDSDNE